MVENKKFVIWFKQVVEEDIDLVGQKGVGLGEMIRAGASVPNGFCITTEAYSHFLRNEGLILKIRAQLKGVDRRDPRRLHDCWKGVKRLIGVSKIPQPIAQETMKTYLRLGGFLREPFVAVL